MINTIKHFNGPAYNPVLDHARLTKQHEVIKALMSDGIFRTLNEIENITGFPQASISAQLRHLKKPRFGSYFVPKRRRNGKGTWEYQVLPPAIKQEANGQLVMA